MTRSSLSLLLSLSLTLLIPSYSINLWPIPTNLSWPIPKSTLLSPSFTILSPPHPYLSPAAARFTHRVLSERHVTAAVPTSLSLSHPLNSLILSVTNPSSPLEPNVDESYSLTINGTAHLNAATVWGAMRGLETFSQLVWTHINTRVVATDIYIYDAPMFGHRGVLLDTGRNYYPVRDILRTVDAISMNKMNVFHWHLTDSQSFPVVLPSVPELGERGAYGAHMRYTASDVMEVVEYAMGRGVRVMPEIDMPG